MCSNSFQNPDQESQSDIKRVLQEAYIYVYSVMYLYVVQIIKYYYIMISNQREQFCIIYYSYLHIIIYIHAAG